MNVLDEAIRLITQPPGDLIYFLVTFFALQQALFAVLTARHRTPQAVLPSRWLWAVGGMLLGRVILIVVGLLDTGGFLTSTQILPPLERWLEFVNVLLVIWAALWGRRTARWQTVETVILLVVSFAFYGFTAWMWPMWEAAGQAFNGFVYELVWEILTAAFLLFYLLLTLLIRPPEWEWAVGLIMFWFLGHAAQVQWPDQSMHFSGWLRLTSLVTMPLLSMFVHRQLPSQTAPQSQKGLPFDVDALQNVLQGVETARELEPSLMIASSRLADILQADVCAVALIMEEDAPVAKIVGVHPLNAAQIETPSLALSDYPALADAYNTRQIQITRPSARAPWLPDVYGKIGVEKVAPLAVVPLAHKERTIGLLLLSNPESKHPWSEDAQRTQQLVATLFAASVARTRQQSQDKSLLERLRGQDVVRQNLDVKLDHAETEVQRLNARITVLVQEIKTRDKEILQLSRDLESRSSGLSQTEISIWQEEIQELAKERGVLQNKTRELTRDRDVLMQERSYLTGELGNVKAELDGAVDVRSQLEAELATLKAGLAEAESAATNAADVQTYTAVGLVVADQDGQITMADALARQMLRLPEGDVTGMPINGAYPDPRWTQTVDALLARGVPNSLKRAHLTLSIEQTPVEVDLVALAGRDGQPDGVAITLRTSESDAEWRETIVSLANDFRTPMTSITGYTDLLLGEQAGILTEMQQQFLERVKANIEQMNHLLNDLVRTASPDSRPIELSPQPVNLIEIIEEAVMGLAARFRERKLAVRLDLPPELAEVQADRDSLYQILLRLVSNAALCSKQGTEVVISARNDEASKSGEFIRISVMDTGGGIAPEDYPRVFRRFYRASQPLIQGMGETGVGMAMAKTLVEANNGRIWVESEPDVGSTFSFILPANGKRRGRKAS